MARAGSPIDPRVGVLLVLALLVTASLSGETPQGASSERAAAQKPEATPHAPEFELEDQFGATHEYAYPREKIAVLLIADKEGSKQVSSWVIPLHDRYKDRIDIDGVADLSAVPGFLRGAVRFFIKRGADHPIMLDWEGAVCGDFACATGKVNVFVVDKDGTIRLTLLGPANETLLEQLYSEIDRLYDSKAGT